MFRCHFTKGARVVAGENLEVETLDLAIQEGWRLLAEKIARGHANGFEIWQGSSLLYSSRNG